MPGGRNGSAIYNLYKLKYKKSQRIHALCETILKDNVLKQSPSSSPPVTSSASSVQPSTEPLNLSIKMESAIKMETIAPIYTSMVQPPTQNKNLIQVLYFKGYFSTIFFSVLIFVTSEFKFDLWPGNFLKVMQRLFNTYFLHFTLL